MTVAIPPETKKSLEAKAGEPGRLSFVVQVSQALDACADHLAAGQMSEAAGLLEDLCKKADAMAKAQGDANLLKMVEHLGNYRTVFQTIRDGGLGSGSDPARYLRITLRAASSSLGW
jgi:hypothetical protein